MENTQTGYDMDEERPRFDALADRHVNGTAPRAVTAFNLFETPEHVAEQMAGMIPQGARAILEPSAGLGRLYRAARAEHSDAAITLIERAPDCWEELKQMARDDGKTNNILADFLTVKTLPGTIDAVIMNPPFQNGVDIKHVRHALTFLRDGGTLVGICAGGPRQARAFEEIADHWEPLPAGTFKDAGTMANTVLFSITK